MKKALNISLFLLLVIMQVLMPARKAHAEKSNSLWITRLTPTGESGHPFDKFQLEFSNPIIENTFTFSDIALTGEGGPIMPLAINKLQDNKYEIDLTGLTTASIYSLSVGPDILDIDNQPLDQNHDNSADPYLATLFATNINIPTQNSTYDGKNLIFYAIQATIDGNHDFTSLELLAGTILTHSAATLADEYRLELNLTDALWIDASSKIDVTGKGYLPGRTIGNSSLNQAIGVAGGSYGGLGAFRDGVPNPTYGDYRNPDELGSGSGNASTYGTTGSAGGGLVRLTADSALIDGSILARGSGPETDGSSGPAGGSGGGIYLQINSLAGSGEIRADGGKNGWGSQEGGAGGGGRVAVIYQTLAGFDLNHVSALSGTISLYSKSAVGTVYLKQSNAPGELRLDSQEAVYSAGAWTPLGLPGDDSFDADNVVISGDGVVAAPEHEMQLNFANLTLLNHANLTHLATTAEDVYTLQLNVSGTLSVDSTATIDVSGKGFLPGRTNGNTSAGQATGTSGGSHGGIGADRDGITNRTYDNPLFPHLPGAGSGNANTYGTTGSSGGGAIHINATDAIISGQILAMGSADAVYPQGPGGGAGGSILLNVNSLTGNGTISAAGGKAGWGSSEGGCSGGGMVAVYFISSDTLPDENINANRGIDGLNGCKAGTVNIINQPAFFLKDPEGNLLHGLQKISWVALGINDLKSQVDVFQAGELAATWGDNLPSSGEQIWDTTTLADGNYELRVTFTDENSVEVGYASRQILIINNAVWHFGDIKSTQTWDSSKVHILASDVAVNSGVTLTIPAGTIIKAASHSELFVQSGGILNANGTSNLPIIFTALTDDTAGGDTNLDQSFSQPAPGFWFGITPQGTGQVNINQYTDLRYIFQRHSGTISSNQTWKSTDLHVVTADVSIADGTTVTIQAGAIVKFYPNTMLTVNSGATLNAPGLTALPIYFTSIKDDSVGGDTNEDGSTLEPFAGDWIGVRVIGTANLNHIHQSYGGGSQYGSYQNFSAFITAESDSTLNLSNSYLYESLFDGIIYHSSNVNIISTIISGSQRGILQDAAGSATINQVVIDHANYGIFCHSAGSQISNTLIMRSIITGINGNCGNIQYSDVWSEEGTNYSGTDQTGLNGNISVDPGLKSPDSGNYRPTFGSALIDSGNGLLSPTNDWMGSPRYDDPRSANTGIAASSGAFCDIGAFEFVESAPSDLDLMITSIAGPQTGMEGSTVSLTWTVKNIGSATIIGPWRDEIGLFALQDDENSLIASEVLVGEGLILGPGQSATITKSVRVPGGMEGGYLWQVTANSRGDIFEGQNRANNIGQSSTPLNLSVPTLLLGGAALPGALNTDYPTYLVKLEAIADQDVVIDLDNADDSIKTEMYISRAAVPTMEKYDDRQVDGAGDLSLTFHSPSNSTYYLLVLAVENPSAIQTFNLRAHALSFSLTSSKPNRVGNSGTVVLTVRGGGFTADAIYEVVDPNGQAHPAMWINFIDSSEVQAQFNFSGLPIGAYTVQVRKNGNTTTLTHSLTVELGKPPVIVVDAVHPDRVRRGSSPTIVFTYNNTSNIDLPPAMMYIKVNENLSIKNSNGASLKEYTDRSGDCQVFGLIVPALGPNQTGNFIVSTNANVVGEWPLSIEGMSIGMDSQKFVHSFDRYATIAPTILQTEGNTHLHASFLLQTNAGGTNLDFQFFRESATGPMLPEMSYSQIGDLETWTHEANVESFDPLTFQDTDQSKSWWQNLWDSIMGSNINQNLNKYSELKNSSELLITRQSINQCLFEKGIFDQKDLDDMNRFAQGTVALQLITEASGGLDGMDAFSGHIEALSGVMGTAWDREFAKKYMDQLNYAGFDPIRYKVPGGNDAQVLMAVMEWCNPTTKMETKTTIIVEESHDPNELAGPQGYGVKRYINGTSPLNYAINFENQPAATLPAQEVTITDQLELSKVDLSSFQLGSIIIGGRYISIPSGYDSFTTSIDLRPQTDLLLHIDASLNHSSGLITWRFTSLDPLTREITPDSLAGFLPPNINSPQGQGTVTYSVNPLGTLATGMTISNQASIIFDYNDPIETNIWVNTIDRESPSSSVQPLPAENSTSFLVSWNGNDGALGSGIARYDIYVSDNEAPFTVWKSFSGSFTSTFKGFLGHHYRFYSVATDGAGNRQITSETAQAETQITYTQVFLPLLIK